MCVSTATTTCGFTNHEVVVIQPWTVTAPYLGSAAIFTTLNIALLPVEEYRSLGGSIISRLDNGAFVGLIDSLLVLS